MGCVWKRGNIYWIKYRRNGESHYESSRSSREKDAKDLLKVREGDIVRGVPVTPRIGNLRYEEAIADLIAHHKMKGRKTERLEARIALHLTPAFAKRRMSDLTTADFTGYAVARQQAEASNATINRELSWLRRAFHLAKQSGKLLHTPHVPMLAEAAPRAGFFERDQVDAVVRHLPAHIGAVVMFGYLTGWRLSEILNLEWRNVDFRSGEIRLDVGSTKNRAGRVIVMTREVRALLVLQDTARQDLKKQGTIVRWVFHHDGQRIRQVRKHWASATKKAALPGRLFHDLRRSAARNFIRSGIPERVAMQLLGHKTRSIFDRYNIVSPGDLVDAAGKLDAVTPSVTTMGDKEAK